MLKKILKIVLITIVVLVLAAIAVPYFFKDKIIAKVKTELNKRLTAQVDFKDVDISLFRHFPRLAVGLEDLQVTGSGAFAGDTLLAVKQIDVALDLMSVIKGGKMDIYNIALSRPRIHAIVNKDGKPNWDIMKPDTSATTSTDTSKTKFALSLRQYSITDAYVSYDDRQGNMQLIVDGLTHKGKGDFTQDQFTLETSTSADGITFRYGLIPYLSNVKTMLDADIQIDNTTSTYTLKNSKAAINNLELALQGFFKIVNDSTYGMDLSFKAPSTDFKDILSLIPVIYKADFNKIKTSGNAAFSGYVKGRYSPVQMPAFGLDLTVKNGFFQYPDLPKPVKNIQIAMKVSNPDGVPDHTTVDMPTGHLEMDNTPLDLRLLVKTPISDLYIDGAAKGKLDLSKITQFVKLENGTALTGLLDADIAAKGNMSAIEKQQYDRFYAAGTLQVSNLLYKSKDYPDGVKVNNLSLQFNPKNVTVKDLNGQYLGTNFQANGEVNNLLAYTFKNAPLDGSLHFKADQVNLNKWMGTTSSTAPAAAKQDTAAAKPFAVPANLNISLQAAVDKVLYDKAELNNVNGTLLVKDETVTMQQLKANALQGTIEINGNYSTRQSKVNPDINIAYNVQNLDVQQTFNTFNTVQKLMPIGKFLSGKINSQLTMHGKLGKDMSPDLSTLTGDGNLLLIQGFLKQFAPVDQLASTLNITPLKDLSLRDIKNYFAFENGRVKVNPFKVVVNGVKMDIAGSHGFDQSLDYTLQLALPRSLMGSAGNSLVNNLASQAQQKGIPINIGDSVHLQVLMAGNILKPSLKTDLKESVNNLKSQAATLVKNKIDTVKNTVRDSVNQIKNNAVNALKNELKNQLSGKKDSTQQSGKPLDNIGKQAGESVKNTLNGLFGKKKKATDSTGNQ
ncbi:MAG TPA: AsmA-like C-terminal region-containing protein [Chitinophaga sp.]|uniref:AsmA-like C-terminal region-containing protein n=1 Tax=Chitinophaga sp. TaxID=1869181 RepID=UPI002B95AF55|nr:AsmA-like C-terminal region-containing protein [Chitinophaga sp.]HVI45983.1 AsmA-like C-terminal region-containing protein [Chitinophaga sp.]